MHHGIQKLLLLGAGHAHLHVLASLARQRPADLDVTLLTPYPHQTYSGMTPGFVAGHYSEDEGRIALEPLVRAAGVRWVQGRCSGIDAGTRTVQVSAAQGMPGVPASLSYHLLSIDTGATLDRTRLETDMPGAATHALAIRPIEAFTALWPQVMAMARRQPVSLAVVGAGAGGVELVFAAEQAIRRNGQQGASFTLVTGGQEVLAHYSPGVQRRVLHQLKRRGITVLRETCTGIGPQGLQLGSGATLLCDVPLLAIGAHAPAWLQGSGLALSDTGQVLVNAFQQSPSHANVFAAGDVCTRADRPHAQSGVYAVRAAPVLLHNLRARALGQPLKAFRPQRDYLKLVSLGGQSAVADKFGLRSGGAWLWRLTRATASVRFWICRPTCL